MSAEGSTIADRRGADEPPTRPPRVAIAHDYLTQRGGAERVVLSMWRAFPDATIYTSVYRPEATYPEFQQARVVTSPLDRIAALRHRHRLALPVLPWGVRRVSIDADVTLVSSSGWAHGFNIEGPRIVYCHNPARWLYQSEDFLGGPIHRSPTGLALFTLRPWLRRWDRRAAEAADRYLTNSTTVRERIRRVYDIEAEVLPPPHALRADQPQEPVPDLVDWADDGFHLVVSRLLPYKHVDRAIEAFRGLDRRLVVIGDGPLADTLRCDLPANARMVSGLSDAQMRWCYARCTALLAPAHEDFGLTPLEAGEFGKPTLALRAGGFLDTVEEGVTGSFFDRPEAEEIRAAVRRPQQWDAPAIVAHATRFREEPFQKRLQDLVAEFV